MVGDDSGVNVKLKVAVQPSASVTLKLYVPGVDRFPKVLLVLGPTIGAPPGYTKVYL